MAKDKKKQPTASGSGGDHGSHDSHGHDHGHDHAPRLTDSIRLGKEADSFIKIAAGVGVVGIGLSVALGGGLSGKQFQHSYLTAYVWSLAIALGALFWVTLQHLMNARASVVVRRLGEIIAQGVVAMLILAIPLLVPIAGHDDVLYSWVNSEFMHSNHALHSKIGYLNNGFFFGRFAVYFLFWILFAGYLLRTSQKQDAGDKGSIASRLQARSAPGMIFVALTITFFAFDFLMSLDPIWFSTIFGVYYFATCMLTFQSVLALGAMWLQKNGRLASAVTKEHYHDIGKMMFGFTAFWTYIGFSQFMLIWYANIPEETHWFHDRLQGAWFDGTLILAATHFVIPFFGLMSREIKRNKKTLGFWAVWVLAVCWFDMHWLVAPNLHKGGLTITLVDLTAWFGVAGLLLAFIVFRAKNVDLVAKGDPRLGRSLAFENI